jgi:hypothetical protein
MLEKMVRRQTPVAEVVVGSTPVVAFGDPLIATVATLGINPSWREFLSDEGTLLHGRARRLSTLLSLNADSTASLRPDQVQTVIAECGAYFRPNRNPYRRWFDPLDEILRRAVGASYYDHTACHLDLVQWATRPTWNRLSNDVRKTLLTEGLPHLQELMRLGNLRTVLLNGRQVLEHVIAAQLVRLRSIGKVHLDPRRSCSLYLGETKAITFVGWSANLQSSWGISLSFRARLAAAINALAVAGPRNIAVRPQLIPAVDRDEPGPQELHTKPNNSEERRRVMAGTIRGRQMPEERDFDDRYVAKGTTVANKRELLKVLRDWLDASGAPTICPIANYGGKPWIIMHLDENRTAVFNADTKRAAIAEYVKYAESRGADIPWSIVPNRNGRWNKLVFKADGEPTVGWYCYLKPHAAERGQV